MLRALSVKLSGLRGDPQRAQALVEYALIIVLIAIVVIAALTALSGGISSAFTRITSALSG
jgi:pilus assembly protein Flp/PilA